MGLAHRVVALVCACFLDIDLAFFSGNAIKITEGGWVTLLLGLAIVAIMTTWSDGMDALDREQNRDRATLADFVRQLRDKNILPKKGGTRRAVGDFRSASRILSDPLVRARTAAHRGFDNSQPRCRRGRLCLCWTYMARASR